MPINWEDNPSRDNINPKERNLRRGIVELEAIVRKQTRNLTGPRCRYDSSHGVEISIVVVVGMTAVVHSLIRWHLYQERSDNNN